MRLSDRNHHLTLHSPTDRSAIVAPYGTLEQARATLRACFGYPDFRPPQIRAVESVLSGRDTLIVLPTGGGKSLCFQVPALIRDGLTVVISPLISLMKDQVDALERRKLPATFLNSTLDSSEVSSRMARVRAGQIKLLYVAPERLDHTATLRSLADVGVALLAVDEAHCISEWGHDFRPSYRRLGAMREQLGSPQTVALTATATPDVRADIVRQLRLRRAPVIVGGFDRTNLTYHVVTTPNDHARDRAAIAWLRSATGPAIVYAPTRKTVERVTSVLVRARIKAVAYHAGLDDRWRQSAQDAFMRERARVIVATSAFGMGIDKPDVRLVVHHAMPGTLEAYYQEAGRAGRDGRGSTCVLLHRYNDRFTHEYFIRGAHPPRVIVEAVWRALASMADRNRLASIEPAELPRHLAVKTDERTVHAALRVLATTGALVIEPPSPQRVRIQLRATPERIRSELRGDRDYDRQVLRALWRAVGARIQHGATVDLDGLPPGFGGAHALVPVLKRLESEQFLSSLRTGGGFRLDARLAPAPGAKTCRLPIDWRALERRRQADLDRLDAMQQYAQTRACRRAYVLRYFGDPEARSNCQACDRCLSSIAHAPIAASAAPAH